MDAAPAEVAAVEPVELPVVSLDPSNDLPVVGLELDPVVADAPPELPLVEMSAPVVEPAAPPAKEPEPEPVVAAEVPAKPEVRVEAAEPIAVAPVKPIEPIAAEPPVVAEPAAEPVKLAEAAVAGKAPEAPSKFAQGEAAPAPKKSVAPLLVGAFLVLAGGAAAFWYLRLRPDPTPGVNTAVPETTVTAQPTATAKPTATVTATAVVTATATATASASATTEPGELAPPADPKSLAPTAGYLIVKAPRTMDVLMSGKRVGDTTTVNETSCVGTKFITLAEPGSLKPVGRAKSTSVKCQAVSTLEFTDADLTPVAAPLPTGGTGPAPTGATPSPTPAPTPAPDTYEPQTP